jgi:hypothetical protein
MQAGFCDDTRMMRSYCCTVKSNLDAATAYKVATVLLRAMKKHGSLLLLVHLPFMRIYSAYFKGGNYYEVLPMLDLEQMLVLRRDALPKGENRCCLCIRHFQVLRELCPKTIFTFSELWWLRPQGSRKH